MTSSDDAPQLFQPLPGRTVKRPAEYDVVLRHLLDLVDAELPAAVEASGQPVSRYRASRIIATAVTQMDPVPEGWFEPMVKAAVYEPDPSFNRFFVEPVLTAFGRRRVQLALIAYLDSGASADAAGAARAWYWTQVSLTYVIGSPTPTPESAAEYEAFSDLRRQYRITALRRFVVDEDLDVRRCILPSLPLKMRFYTADMHDLVTRAIEIARTSGDEYLQHRVEIQIASEPRS